MHMHYKMGQPCITDWGSSAITNQDRCYQKLGYLLKVRAAVITKWGNYSKLCLVLNIRTTITNCNLTPVPKPKYWEMHGEESISSE